MNKTDLISLWAAHKYLADEQGKKPTVYINLSEVNALLHANEKKVRHQGWSFLGSKADWKRCVQPYFGGV